MENIKGKTIASLRARLRGLNGSVPSSRADAGALPFSWGDGGLHELYALSPADAVAANAFGLGLAVQAAAGRPILWGLDPMTVQEAGAPHGPGLHEMGVRPKDVFLVRAHDARDLLWAAEEALRNPVVGAVVLSVWGEAKVLTLTASRRLLLAARAGKTSLLLARTGVEPAPSAAETRWAVRAAASAPMEGDAPGRPAFSASLLRHRGGSGLGTWIMEWDREQRVFVEQSAGSASLSGDLVPVAAERAAGAREDGLRRVA